MTIILNIFTWIILIILLVITIIVISITIYLIKRDGLAINETPICYICSKKNRVQPEPEPELQQIAIIDDSETTTTEEFKDNRV